MAEHKACADVVADTGEDVANSTVSQGECALMLPAPLLRSQSSQSSGVDDSGTESGDDFRLLSPEILAEVQSALTRLESALPGLDPVRRESLIQLVNRLQNCLKLQVPNTVSHSSSKRFANKRLLRQKRHTVGVSKEELADARRWLLETGLQDKTESGFSESTKIQKQNSAGNIDKIENNETENENESIVSKVFRPVKFVPSVPRLSSEIAVELKQEFIKEKPVIEKGFYEPILHRSSVDYVDEPLPLSASMSFENETMELDNGSSLLEYDPSLVLFTPAQSVQIAVHKAAINKQISQEESKRRGEESDEGDISSTEEEQTLVPCENVSKAVSSSQCTAQVPTDSTKKNTTPVRFHARNSKKLKMKRANTIDIPKPLGFYDIECSSGDEYDRASADETHHLRTKFMHSTEKKVPQPTFEPKTENDMKFLAFLQQSKQNSSPKTLSYNPSARGGQHWSNRFTNIKTAFEMPVEKESIPAATSKTFLSNTSQWQGNIKNEPPPLRQAVQNRSPQPLQNKLPWKTTEEEGVVIGSLTVSKKQLGSINQFSHASKSAFKPIDKISVQKSQPTPSTAGTVKRLADQRSYGNNIPSKSVLKQYPPVHDKEFSAPDIKNQIQNVPKIPPKHVINSHQVTVPNYQSTPHQQQFSSNNASPHTEYTHYNNTENPPAQEQIYNPYVSQQCQSPSAEHNNSNTKYHSFLSYPYTVDSSPLETHSEFYVEQNLQNVSNENQNYFKNSRIEPCMNSEIKTNVNHPVKPRKSLPLISNNTVTLQIPLVKDQPIYQVQTTPHVKAINDAPVNQYGYDMVAPNIPSMSNSDSKTNVQYVGIKNNNKENYNSVVSLSHKQYDMPLYQFDDGADSISASPVICSKGKEDSNRSSPNEILEEQTAVTRVMGRRQCQQAVTISNRTQHRYDDAAKKLESELRLCLSSKLPIKGMAKSPPINISSQAPSNTFQMSPTNVTLKIPINISSTVNNSQKTSKNISSNLSEIVTKNVPATVSSSSINIKKTSASKRVPISPTITTPSKTVTNVKLPDTDVTAKSLYHHANSVNSASLKVSSDITYNSVIKSSSANTMSKSHNVSCDSPTFTNVLQKSESWHQMVKEQMSNARLAPPKSPRLSKAKSSHTLAFPKQFEATLSADAVSAKQSTVDYYLNQTTKKEHKIKTKEKKSAEPIIKLNDDLDNVDEAFETLFIESSKKKRSK